MYLLLWVFGPTAALGLARRFDLGVAATLVSVLVGLAPGYLAWHSFRADRAEADPVDLDRVVGELALAVRNQWHSEAAVRRVNDPYPLPVSWQAADDSLTESWALMTDLARSWPGGPPGDPALWPPEAAGLAGRDAEIGQVFTERVPTRRLVILGEPGAGKSVLLIRLLQDLIARRTDGAPVPMLFSLASWEPHQSLKAWMADQLRRTHPGLATAAPSSVTVTDTARNEPTDLAAYLLSAGLILPLLDGFDELPPALHATALDMLNRALPAKQPLVLTSRTDPYLTALTRLGTVVRLNGAAAIQPLPLDAQAAADYLRRDAGGPHTPAAQRWNSVITHLGTNSPVGQALATRWVCFWPAASTTPGPADRPDPHRHRTLTNYARPLSIPTTPPSAPTSSRRSSPPPTPLTRPNHPAGQPNRPTTPSSSSPGSYRTSAQAAPTSPGGSSPGVYQESGVVRLLGLQVLRWADRLTLVRR
ncbi:NACHT domain-containing protein [Streptomyces sp. NPDC005046]